MYVSDFIAKLPPPAIAQDFRAEPPLAAPRVVPIAAGTYISGGVNTPMRHVTVADDFETPPGEITNEQGDAVLAEYGATPDGLYFWDKLTRDGFHLYALGQGTDLSTFKTIHPSLLPPVLGIRERFEEIFANPQRLARFEFGRTQEDIKRALPAADRYQSLAAAMDPRPFMAPDVPMTMVSGWQAQAIAQLLGTPKLQQDLFGLSGNYYADLLTTDQWGLMAMQAELDYMTAPEKPGSRGKLLDGKGNPLRAIDLPTIVPATNYPPLPNKVYPNMVKDWVRDFVLREVEVHVLGNPNVTRRTEWRQIRCGAPWIHPNHISAYRSASRSEEKPDEDKHIDTGLRVGFFRRVSIT